MLQVTPNGPWGKDVHPQIPVSVSELAADLRACFQAGATGVHLHVRDPAGAETLKPAVVNDTCRVVRRVAADVGSQVEIGLTTGEWIVPDLADRIAMIREWEDVDCATVNLSERGFEAVMEAMLDAGDRYRCGLVGAGRDGPTADIGTASAGAKSQHRAGPRGALLPSG